MGGSDNDSLELADFILGAFGAALTLLNLIALYADMVATIRQAPKQMREAFGNVRQQLGEEREALTHQMRQSRLTQEQQRKLRDSHAAVAAANGHGNGSGGNENGGVVLLPLTYTDETLLLHYNTLKNLWVQFKELERPFLLPLDEVHLAESAAYQLDRDDSWNTEHFRAARLDPPLPPPPRQHGSQHRSKKTKSYDHKHEFLGPEALESLYQCSFVHRFIWWRTKPDVKRLGEKVVKIMLRRMEREVTQTRLMVMQSRGMDFKYDGLFYENNAAALGGDDHGDHGYDARGAAAAAAEAEHRKMAHRRSSRRGTAAVPTTMGADGWRPRRASSAGPSPVVIRDDRIYRQREDADRGREYYVTRPEAANWWGPRGGIRHSRSRSPRRS
ncbi:hypothetical protein PG993_011881 [Apiospora rasikravindrae]|uniref:Uncharacterized protein n=1 Tax=Apiospora rasikravindrae TaxID=990691 RepID=A0ABR1S0Y3_9PEZI